MFLLRGLIFVIPALLFFLGMSVWLPRTLLGFGVAALLPWLGLGVIRAAVRKESNGINAMTLGILTAIDVVVLALFVGDSVTGIWLPVLGVASMFFGAWYNIWVLSFAAYLEDV